MKTLNKPNSSTYRDKGSKFIGFLFPISSKDAFEKELKKIKSKYPDATHHCYAWRVTPHDIEEFSQDDGEPAGSAGPPILNQLKSFEVVNCGCVVVRYYGGTNLGKSGLIRAYGQTAKQCLQNATLVTLIPTRNYLIVYPYSKQTYIDQLKNRFDLKEINADYREKITLEIACRSKQAEKFAAALKQLRSHGIKVDDKGSGFVTMQS